MAVEKSDEGSQCSGSAVATVCCSHGGIIGLTETVLGCGDGPYLANRTNSDIWISEGTVQRVVRAD